ncbi:MAG: helix-turn-helix transcriptional regulator [Candidatus Aminicenantes bacterium]|nr:MAG: helix-turn-helix transcriptional regulator [Candidatus Aminicenantes bacterium]
MSKIDPLLLKKEIGRRFKEFRKAIGKKQVELAKELHVYQSTITNIEVGKTFPRAHYLYHWQNQYNLNINWIVTGTGDMFSPVQEKKLIFPYLSLLYCHIRERDPKYEQYVELMSLMVIPFVEQIILAKLEEIKLIAKEEIDSFLKQR